MKMGVYSGVRRQNSGVRMRRKPAKDFRNGVAWQKAHPLEEVSKLLRVPFRVEACRSFYSEQL